MIFEASKNKKRAKEFVAFLMQDENLQPYVEGSLGRWFPVTKSGTQSAFWQADPHRKAVYNQFGAGTVTFEFTKNYKFTILNNENVWAKAMSRVVNDNVAGGKGDRRDDRAHQAGRRLTSPASRSTCDRGAGGVRPARFPGSAGKRSSRSRVDARSSRRAAAAARPARRRACRPGRSGG